MWKREWTQCPDDQHLIGLETAKKGNGFWVSFVVVNLILWIISYKSFWKFLNLQNFIRTFLAYFGRTIQGPDLQSPKIRKFRIEWCDYQLKLTIFSNSKMFCLFSVKNEHLKMLPVSEKTCRGPLFCKVESAVLFSPPG